MPVTVIERLGLKKRYQALPKDTAGGLHPSATGVFNQSENTLVENHGMDSSSVPALAPPLPPLNDGEILKGVTAEDSSASNKEHIRDVSSSLALRA